ncbi:hypothetical protein [Actinophytocola sp.]|uniref:hypothetical protein n=1 Tax=Actinophytocola sp. TaxID=1872138 RepID=UPI002ED97514
MGFTVDKEAVADFGFYLGAEAGHTLPLIERLARDEGMSHHGFTGLLAPLGDIVTGPASVSVGLVFSEMQRKLCDLGDSVTDAAKHYGWVDHSNASMFERAGLTGDTKEEIKFGGYGRDGFENYFEGGGSIFRATATDIPNIERPNTKYSDDVREHGLELRVLDWIWRQFDVDHGKGFTDSIISPLAGNYKSIEANGKAWKSVGTNFGRLADSVGKNSIELATHSWQGGAGDAFRDFLGTYWNQGAVWAGEQMGTFVASGFDKISQVSKYIAGVAIRLINQVIDKAKKIATKFAPVVGWAWTAIQSAAKWLGKVFGFDVNDLWNDVQDIIAIVREIKDLYTEIQNIVKTMESYFTTVEQLQKTVSGIPETGSLADAQNTYTTIRDGVGQLNQNKNELNQSFTKAGSSLSTLDDISKRVRDRHR